MTGTQISIDSACRDFEYFVDPDSTEMVELGTQKYPYRSMKSVTSEILNHFTHHLVEVKVYVKDVYLEDRTMIFVNMTNVVLTTHPEGVSANRRSVITATEFEQTGVGEKAKFHLLSNTDHPSTTIINNADFSDYEKGSAAIVPTNFVLRAGLELNNIEIYREEIDYNKDVLFITSIFQQTLGLRLSKS